MISLREMSKDNAEWPKIVRYQVTLDKDLTVDEFCKAVVKDYPDHWGSILVISDRMYQCCTNFSNGKINIKIATKIKHKKVFNTQAVKSAWLCDGRIDFYVEVMDGRE